MVSNNDMRRWNNFGNQVTDTFKNANFSSGMNGGNFFEGNSGWGYGANVAKSGYNAITGKDDKDYSDVEESTIYPLYGAAKGYSYGGPWGALGGALYGTGYSFKDDVGMKDSNFLTQMVFPLDMGDGGGLRINGKSVLKL